MRTHLVNCTYCIFRLVTLGNKKRSHREIERCEFTHQPIPKPSEPDRFCERIHQIDHDCESCL